MEKEEKRGLFGYLEFSGFDHPSALVTELVNVDAAVEVGEVDGGAVGYIGQFIHFPATHETVDLYGITLVIAFLEVKIDNGSGGVGIESNYAGHSAQGEIAALGIRVKTRGENKG